MSETVPSTPRPPHDRRPFVLTTIGLASLLFLATEILLYVRWTTLREPSCVLVVNTALPLRGAVVEVDGGMLFKALKVTVGDEGRYSIPFYVDPGEYSVRLLVDGEEQYKQEKIRLPRARTGVQVDLTHFIPTTTPSTLPAGNVF